MRGEPPARTGHELAVAVGVEPARVKAATVVQRKHVAQQIPGAGYGAGLRQAMKPCPRRFATAAIMPGGEQLPLDVIEG